MKRTLTLFLALFLALGSCATCVAELSGTIRYSTWGSETEKQINEAIIAAFEEENPGCTVELEYIPSKYTEKIDTMFVGGDAPDVIYGHPHYFVSWAANDLLMNLDDMFEAERDFFYDEKFATHMYEMFKYDDHHIATVNGHDTFLLFYNKTLFDEAGVPYPTDAWTWEDFLNAGRKLTCDTDSGKQYAISFSEIQPIIFSYGGDYFDSMDNPTQVVYKSDETIAALQFVQDCIKEGIAPNTTSSDQLGGTFATGKFAMEISGAWSVANYANIDAFEWDVAQVPLRAGYPRRTAAFVAGYAVNDQTKNPELAKAFAKYFQSDRAQELLGSLGLITVINNEISGSDKALKGENAPEHAYLRVETMNYATNGYASLPNYLEMFNNVIKPAYDRLVALSCTAEECASDIQTQLEALMLES